MRLKHSAHPVWALAVAAILSSLVGRDQAYAADATCTREYADILITESLTFPNKVFTDTSRLAPVPQAPIVDALAVQLMARFKERFRDRLLENWTDPKNWTDLSGYAVSISGSPNRSGWSRYSYPSGRAGYAYSVLTCWMPYQLGDQTRFRHCATKTFEVAKSCQGMEPIEEFILDRLGVSEDAPRAASNSTTKTTFPYRIFFGQRG